MRSDHLLFSTETNIQIPTVNNASHIVLLIDTTQYSMYVCMVITYSKSMDQSGKVANPARCQLNREKENFPVLLRA